MIMAAENRRSLSKVTMRDGKITSFCCHSESDIGDKL